MAYLCPTPNTDNIIAIVNKSIKTPVISINASTVQFNKNIKAFTPNVDSIIAITTKTVTEPGYAYNAIFTPTISKAVFNPIMTPVAGSQNRPSTGQMWPRNIIIRS